MHWGEGMAGIRSGASGDGARGGNQWFWLCLVLEVKRKGEGGFDRSQTWGGIWLG